MTEHHPINVEAYRPRPPYTTDPALERDLQRGEPVETWRQRLHADRMAALTEQAPADLTDHERHHLEWLSTWEDNAVAITASLLHRARVEGRRQGAAEAITQDAEMLRDKAGSTTGSEKPASVLRRLAATLDRRARKLRH